MIKLGHAVLCTMLISGASALASAEEVRVGATDSTYFTVDLKNLDISLPIKLKSALNPTQSGSNYVGTTSFLLNYSSNSKSSGSASQPQGGDLYPADLQASVYACDSDARLADLRVRYQAAHKFLDAQSVRSQDFDGFVFSAEDLSRDTVNMTYGVSDKLTGDCYALSLAIYNVGGKTPAYVRRLAKPISDGILESLNSFAKGHGG